MAIAVLSAKLCHNCFCGVPLIVASRLGVFTSFIVSFAMHQSFWRMD